MQFPSPPTGPQSAPLSFGEACDLVVDYLKREVPLAFWSVTQYDDGRQVYLRVRDEVYGKSDGDSYPWSDSFCQHMVAGVTPQIAPDAMAIPEYAAMKVSSAVTIGAYVGVPIQGANGELFGTLCGLDPHRQPGSLRDHAPLLQLCATLLSQILLAECLRLEAIDREAELHWNAFHDHLTGLSNRAQFLHDVSDALTHPGGRGTVMLIDLDDFKAVNDVLGHAAGDSLLKMVARRLRTVLSAGDALARLGGDEFAIFTRSADPAAVAERICAALHEPFPIADTFHQDLGQRGCHAGRTRPPGAARGRPPRPCRRRRVPRQACGKGSVGLLRRRDRTLGHRGGPAPRAPAGGGRIGRDRGLLPADRRPPDGTTRRVRGPGPVAPQRRVRRPDVFIPIAARSGLLPALTDHMLDLACAQTAAWSRELGHRDLRIGVNVSAACISDKELLTRVACRLHRHALGPHQLTLEVTEGARLADSASAAAVARLLRDLDVRLALDDFGSGYSSLLRLKTLPLQGIKIDRRFIGDIDTSPDSQRFLRALLNLSRDLELAMVVEGIERQSQADVLRALGCTYAQGHLFGRPVPPTEIDLHGG